MYKRESKIKKKSNKKSVPTSNPAKFLESILATTINVKGYLKTLYFLYISVNVGFMSGAHMNPWFKLRYMTRCGN